tara:strand:- start:4400 stop:4885 length:486 start_codon:yes stop_codon:yes gene_type:complete
MNLKLLTQVFMLLSIAGCSMFSADRYPVGVADDVLFSSEPDCKPTIISPNIIDAPSSEWKQRIIDSSSKATKVLGSPEFTAQCQSLKMTRTNGKSIQEVCREMVCAETAKQSAGAGDPGNMAHEFTHTLDYTHFSNWAWLGTSSVPYRVGNLVNKLAKDTE